jgi:hypothetical protein
VTGLATRSSSSMLEILSASAQARPLDDAVRLSAQSVDSRLPRP